MKHTIKFMMEMNNRAYGENFGIEQYTCFDCQLWKECEFAFDGYNTNGDCLAEK